MALKLRDAPGFPDYIEGQTNHQFMQAAWAQGPLAIDDKGIVSVFSAEHMAMLIDDRWTRQLELEIMRASGVSGGAMYDFIRDVMLFSNDQVHRNRRGPMVKTFAHRAIAELRPEVATRCTGLIAPLVGTGSTDFLGAIAGPLPALVVASVMGAPEEEAAFFASHVYSAIRGLSIVPDDVREESTRDMAALGSYMETLVAERRARPKEDMLTSYLQRVQGGPMDESEVRAQLLALLVAGSDTTRGALTATVSQLMQNPAQWDLLVSDPERWAPAAVAEGLRFDPVIGSLARVTTERRELAGYDIPAGTIVGPSMLTALRDPEVYAEPDRFDITRTDHPRLHPIFGGGPHRCLGEALARIELEEALIALARLAPHMTLDGPPARLSGYGAVRIVSPLQVVL